MCTESEMVSAPPAGTNAGVAPTCARADAAQTSATPAANAASAGAARRAWLLQAEMASDDHALDLIGAFPDLEDLLVAVQP